jgi:nucleotide-binding universal stress UspA family protein
MYERLLVAVDHSEYTKDVLDATRKLADIAKSEVLVLHVREREVLPRVGLVPTETDDEVHKEVGAAVSELTGAGIKARGEIVDAVYGRAAKEIVDSAERHNAGVIVMGSRGRSDLAGLVLGSTAHKVIHLSERPVLVVR